MGQDESTKKNAELFQAWLDSKTGIEATYRIALVKFNSKQINCRLLDHFTVN
jgi:hypothetical protein